jgi:hypothetical protein
MLDNADSAIVHLDSAVFAARAICGDPSRPMAGTVLFVRVVDPDNWNVPGDSVFATWTKPPTRILGLTFSREGRFEGRTDHDGRVAVCDPPRGEPVSLIVGHESRPQVSTTVTLPVENPIAMVTVRLPRPSSN